MIRTLALSQHGHYASNIDPASVLVRCFWEVESCQHEPDGHNDKFPFPRPGEQPSLSGSKQPSCLLIYINLKPWIVSSIAHIVTSNAA